MNTRETSVPTVVRWVFGPLLLGAGGLALAAAFSWIPLEPARTHAPLWIVGAVGASFATMGLVLLLDGVAALRRLQGWLAFVFLVSFTSVFNWIAFGPGERHFTTRTNAGSGAIGVATATEGGEFGGRFMFGVLAVLLNLLVVSPLILWVWRRLRSPTDRGSTGSGT